MVARGLDPSHPHILRALGTVALVEVAAERAFLGELLVDAAPMPRPWHFPGRQPQERRIILDCVDAPQGWLLVAPLAELEAEGAVVTLDVGRERLVVVRGRELHAFHNVCQHRGHPLVEGDCRRQRLRCPYHGWIYGLDGRLEHVPDRASFDDLEGVALRGVELAIRAPFAWVRLTGDGPVPGDFALFADWAIADRVEAPVAAVPPRIGANALADTNGDVVVGRLAVTATGCRAAAWRLVPPGAVPAPSLPLLARLGLE